MKHLKHMIQWLHDLKIQLKKHVISTIFIYKFAIQYLYIIQYLLGAMHISDFWVSGDVQVEIPGTGIIRFILVKVGAM